jgi:leucyl aminopeptidase
MHMFAPKATKQTIGLELVSRDNFGKWLAKMPKRVQNWLALREVKGEPGRSILVPDENGGIDFALGVTASAPSLWDFASIASRLPAKTYEVRHEMSAADAEQLALGWGLAGYRFSAYKTRTKVPECGVLVWPNTCDRKVIESFLHALFLGRDLINTPASDLGPSELAAAAKAVAKRHGATYREIRGAALLKANYPAIHAVGRGSAREPVLIDFRGGSAKAPKVTIVGKGVVFDSGGLNLKPSSGMRLMKKDMGGAAAALALADLVLANALPVQLRVLIPAVENSVSGNSYRPGDILETRKGLRVEVGDTDAEGRLVLSDALAEAASESPELIIDFATLTGAARVALGTEVPALFCNEDQVANDLFAAGESTDDPLWRLPLFASYRRHLESSIADLCNISRVGEGGAITAALFLQNFVEGRPWIHIDTMGWNSGSRPGRPEGGEVLAVRAVYEYLRRRFAAAPLVEIKSQRAAKKSAKRSAKKIVKKLVKKSAKKSKHA